MPEIADGQEPQDPIEPFDSVETPQSESTPIEVQTPAQPDTVDFEDEYGRTHKVSAETADYLRDIRARAEASQAAPRNEPETRNTRPTEPTVPTEDPTEEEKAFMRRTGLDRTAAEVRELTTAFKQNQEATRWQNYQAAVTTEAKSICERLAKVAEFTKNDARIAEKATKRVVEWAQNEIQSGRQVTADQAQRQFLSTARDYHEIKQDKNKETRAAVEKRAALAAEAAPQAGGSPPAAGGKQFDWSDKNAVKSKAMKALANHRARQG